MAQSNFGKGVFFAAASYGIWGVLPLFWKTLVAVSPWHILAFRILMSLLLIAFILLIQKNTAWIAAFRDKQKAVPLILSALTISFNWGLNIWAVNRGHTIETSLGYFINPMVSIALGLCIFREKLNRLQWIAFALAALGVLILTALSGSPPWISLGLALSFGLYGLLKKTISLQALESLGAETLAAAPLGILLLFVRFDSGVQFDGGALRYLTGLPFLPRVFVFLCGAVTTLPLYFFARGARLLPLSTLGFVQFISPTLQFVVGFFVFGEYFPPQNFAAMACIWGSALLYILSLKKAAPESLA